MIPRVDPKYLDYYFVTPEMHKLLEGYQSWRRTTGRKDTPLSWMTFIREHAINDEQYKFLEGIRAQRAFKKALDELIQIVRQTGEGKWIDNMPDVEKFLIVEKLISKYRLEDKKAQLQLYRALAPGFRKWSWEDLVAAGVSDAEIIKKMNDFMEKIQILKLNDNSSTALESRIQGIWELRWIYTNKDLPDAVREKALDMLFEVLDARVQNPLTGFKESEVLWRNAREVLREFFTAKRWNGIEYEADKEIWEPVFERALQAIENANSWGSSNYVELPSMFDTESEFWSWWAITDALSSVKFDDNPELIQKIVESNSSELIRHVLPSALMYSKPTQNSRLRDRLIQTLYTRFMEAEDPIWVESLGETLMKIGSPKLVDEMLEIAKGEGEIRGDENTVFEKRRWAIRTLGESYYFGDKNSIADVRNELFKIALFDQNSKLRNTALASIFTLNTQLRRIGKSIDLPSNKGINSDRVIGNISKLLASEDINQELFLQELNRLTSKNYDSIPGVEEDLGTGDSQIISSVLKALVATLGAQRVTQQLISEESYTIDISEIETLTQIPFEEILGYMWIRKPSEYKWIDPILNAEFSTAGNTLVINGKEYKSIGFPRDLDRAVEVFRAEDGSMVMLKYGSELQILSEYIAHRIYAEFIRKKWGENSGIGVSPLGLVRDPRDGRIKLVSPMISGYKKGTKYLPPQYIHDERLQSIIGPALLLGDGTRTPKGMLFLQRDFEQPLGKEYDTRPDYLLFNYGALLFSDGIGFKPFGRHFEVRGNFNEFDVLTHSSHTGVKNDYANEAWAELIEGEDRGRLDDLLADLELIRSSVTKIILGCFDDFDNLISYRYETSPAPELWKKQIDAENIFGRWNLSKRRIRRALLTAMFNNILADGSLSLFIADALATRMEEIETYLGYKIRRGVK